MVLPRGENAVCLHTCDSVHTCVRACCLCIRTFVRAWMIEAVTRAFDTVRSWPAGAPFLMHGAALVLQVCTDGMHCKNTILLEQSFGVTIDKPCMTINPTFPHQ